MSDIQSINQRLYILNKFCKRLKKQIFLHNQSSLYYDKQNKHFVIPGILITGLSSITSFLSTSDIITNNNKQILNICVGVMTAGATILQSISSSYGFKSKAESFQKAADLYDNLLTKIEFEIVNPNENLNDFCNNIEETILQIKNDCKYLPPLFIQKMWIDYKYSKHNDDEDDLEHKNNNNLEHIDNLNDIIINNPNDYNNNLLSENFNNNDDINV